MQGPPPRNFLPMTALLFAAATHRAFLVEQVTPLALLAFALCQAVALPFWGALSDRVARRKAVIYSLVATLATAVASYSRLALAQQFVFSVLNGLVTAGLLLAVASTFESRDKRPENSSRGAIACAFFGGTVLMMDFNSPAVTLLLVTVALVLSALFFARLFCGFFVDRDERNARAVAWICRIKPDAVCALVEGIHRLSGHGLRASCGFSCGRLQQ
jgi:MFS family permease